MSRYWFNRFKGGDFLFEITPRIAWHLAADNEHLKHTVENLTINTQKRSEHRISCVKYFSMSFQDIGIHGFRCIPFLY